MNVTYPKTFATGMRRYGDGTMDGMPSDLMQSPLFRDMLAEHVEALDSVCERFSCPAGVIILEQGSEAEHIFLILRGTVEISFNPDDGLPITIAHVGPGGCFGWSAILGSERYTSSVIAIEDLAALRIEGNALRDFCSREPEAGRAFLERLADSVAGRWKDAHGHVRSILEKGMERNT